MIPLEGDCLLISAMMFVRSVWLSASANERCVQSDCAYRSTRTSNGDACIASCRRAIFFSTMRSSIPAADRIPLIFDFSDVTIFLSILRDSEEWNRLMLHVPQVAGRRLN